MVDFYADLILLAFKQAFLYAFDCFSLWLGHELFLNSMFSFLISTSTSEDWMFECSVIETETWPCIMDHKH